AGLGLGLGAVLGPDELAAKAKPAVDRAHVDRLEQGAIGVAMGHARDRRVWLVADRIAELLGGDLELGGAWDKLRGDWIGGVVGDDQLDDLLGDRRCESSDDALDRDQLVGVG